MLRDFRRSVAALSLSLLASLLAALAAAQGPPPGPPDFYWPYGRVSIAGENVSPTAQPVVAIVNGNACGSDTTRIAAEGPDVPPGDVGRTVYVVNILPDGAGAGQAPGCGRPGEWPRLWFPAASYLSEPMPAFRIGGLRVDIDLVTRLGERRTLPLLTGEGTY